MSGQGKSFKKVTFRLLYLGTQKEHNFTFLMFLISRRVSNSLLFICLIDSGLKQP
jgi:hypothetical protein